MDEEDIIDSQASTQSYRATQESQNVSLMEDKIWGKLIPESLNKNFFDDYSFKNDLYSFGRGTTDFKFNSKQFIKTYLALSKTHFIIRREIRTNSDYVITVEDKSSNGTFLNGELIGRNKKKFLKNNDSISLANKNSRDFVFHDSVNNDSSNYPAVINEKYIILKKLGDGAYGEVRIIHSLHNNFTGAVKIMKKRYVSKGGTTLKNNEAMIENEVTLLRSVKHPCIIKLMDIIQTDEFIYIVMELASGGELFDRIQNNTKLTEDTGKLYIYQLMLAIQYLHDKKITHRDIKPENILLEKDEENTRIKLTDFGLSKLGVSQMKTYCGTTLYIAPELFLSKNIPCQKYTNKVDMWSIGVVLFVCLLGYLPFNGRTENERMKNVQNMKMVTNSTQWKSISKDAQDLIKRLIVVDPEQRYSAEQTLNHPWFQDPVMLKKAKDLLSFEIPVVPPKKSPRKRALEMDVDEEQTDVDKTPKMMSGITEFSSEKPN